MYIYLEENTNSYHKGQLTPFFIAILTILIIGILVTVNIGKVSVIKTHNSNSADAGALAVASTCASIFDSLAMASQAMYMMYAYFLGNIERMLDEAKDDVIDSYQWAIRAEISALLGVALGYTPYAGKFLHIILVLMAVIFFILAGYYFQRAWVTMAATESVIETMQETQMSYYESIRENIEQAMSEAPNAGYAYGLINSGFGSMMDSDSSEYTEYENAIDNYSSSFSFADGQGRGHSVDISVGLAQIGAWHVYKTIDDLDTILDYFFEFDLYAIAISVMYVWAASELTQEVDMASYENVCSQGYAWHTMACPPLCVCVIPTAVNTYAMYVWWAVALAMATILEIAFLPPLIEDIRNGVQENGVITDPSGEEILVTIQDVTHSRSLSVSSKQSHAGANLGLWTTSYPTVNASATASFSGGNVDGHSPSQTHDPRLTGAN
jgi:hypothetical protein